MKFQNPSIHHSKVNTHTDRHTDRQAESNMPFQLFQSWGHKNLQSQWTVKYRSRSAGQGACLKGMSRTITMQGFTLAAITDAENSFFFFLIQFNVPFQDYFSSYETGQSVGGAKTGEPREKPPDTPASRTWLVSHVARAGLEPTPVTAVR